MSDIRDLKSEVHSLELVVRHLEERVREGGRIIEQLQRSKFHVNQVVQKIGEYHHVLQVDRIEQTPSGVVIILTPRDAA